VYPAWYCALYSNGACLGFLAKGNDGHTLMMVAINSLTMLFLYGALVLSIGI